MIEQFKAFLIKHRLESNRPILIGTSGGIDSIVLCQLYLETNIPFSIAHCNFNLRGYESDQDEEFVRNWASSNKISFFSKSFQTKAYAEEKGISIQMAARDLRVKWFEDLCQSNNYNYYATAHHQDDSIETYLINQIRGTGISGLHGISPKNGKLIHPLLFTSREQIRQYALDNHLKWREDSSNKTIKYLRNKVRNQLIPLLEEINPQIKPTLLENISRLKSTENLYNAKIKEIQNEIFSSNTDESKIHLDKLFSYPENSLILFEIIQEYGFNFTQSKQILEDNDLKSGPIIESETHLVLKNRNQLIIRKKNARNNEVWRIEKGTDLIQNPIHLRLTYKDTFEIIKEENIAQFDIYKLKFPLFVRKWRQGDYFFPIGMKGKKKLLSDYFIDKKLSKFEKEDIWLLCSGNEIIWIIGHRIDDRFKITAHTKQILQISC